jgi:hypothetical protein
VADRPGFELAVRLGNFAFEFSAEFRAERGKLPFGENFARELLDVNVRVRLRGPVSV